VDGADGEAGAEFCAAAVGIAQRNAANMAIGIHNFPEVIARLIGFFLEGMKVRGIIRYSVCRHGGDFAETSNIFRK
jgi:hypothetical protein